jgi:hypothetical protein
MPRVGNSWFKEAQQPLHAERPHVAEHHGIAGGAIS